MPIPHEEGTCKKLGKLRFSTDSVCAQYKEVYKCGLIPLNAHSVCGICGFFYPKDGRCSSCITCGFAGDRGPVEENPIAALPSLLNMHSEMYAQIAQIVEESRKFPMGKKEDRA